MTDGCDSVKCKPVWGPVDRASGVVFRYQDENNYHFMRANALEDNVHSYCVKNGRRIQPTGAGRSQQASGMSGASISKEIMWRCTARAPS